MTDYEVEQRLGYTPCVCAKIDGTWHPKCYAGKTREQIAAGYKRAFAAARRNLKAKAAPYSKTPNDKGKRTPEARSAVGGPLDPPVVPL